MRVTLSCPFNCDDEEHEIEVEPEYDCGRLGWYGGIAEGEPLPCGNVPTKAQFAELQNAIYDRIIERAHPDP